MLSFIKTEKEYFVIRLRVIPNAKKSEIIGVLEDALKIKISSVPVEGKANAQIIKFFSDYLNISKSKLEIISGEKNKNKLLKISCDFEKVKEKFLF